MWALVEDLNVFYIFPSLVRILAIDLRADGDIEVLRRKLRIPTSFCIPHTHTVASDEDLEVVELARFSRIGSTASACVSQDSDCHQTRDVPNAFRHVLTQSSS